MIVTDILMTRDRADSTRRATSTRDITSLPMLLQRTSAKHFASESH